MPCMVLHMHALQPRCPPTSAACHPRWAPRPPTPMGGQRAAQASSQWLSPRWPAIGQPWASSWSSQPRWPAIGQPWAFHRQRGSGFLRLLGCHGGRGQSFCRNLQQTTTLAAADSCSHGSRPCCRHPMVRRQSAAACRRGGGARPAGAVLLEPPLLNDGMERAERASHEPARAFLHCSPNSCWQNPPSLPGPTFASAIVF
jgi:hypothetical protein